MSSLGLLAWFRHAYFEYHSHVRLRFKLAAGLGEPWTRDGGIPQGCPLSMMFIVALYLPWCRYLSAQERVEPQLYADNLKCVSRDPALLLRAARFTTGYVRLVGQEPAPSKCLLLSTSKAVRKDMKDWVFSQEGDEWSVKFDVRDLGGHFDTTFRGWSVTLASRVRFVLARLVFIFAVPLDFHGGVRVVRSMYLPAALHGIEASLLASDSLRKLRSSIHRVVVLVPYLALWMDLLGVTLLFVWSGFGFACCVGILLCGLPKLVVLFVFLRWLVRVALVMVLSIFSLPVLLMVSTWFAPA